MHREPLDFLDAAASMGTDLAAPITQAACSERAHRSRAGEDHAAGASGAACTAAQQAGLENWSCSRNVLPAWH